MFHSEKKGVVVGVKVGIGGSSVIGLDVGFFDVGRRVLGIGVATVVGSTVGWATGVVVGCADGFTVGAPVGSLVGDAVGTGVVTGVGAAVGGMVSVPPTPASTVTVAPTLGTPSAFMAL